MKRDARISFFRFTGFFENAAGNMKIVSQLTGAKTKESTLEKKKNIVCNYVESFALIW